MSHSVRTLVTVVVLALAACTDNSPAAAPRKASPPEPVITQPVRIEPQKTRVEAVGTSRAQQSVAIYPKVSGEVEKVNFRAGQKVQAGEVLVQLDSRDEALAVQLAEVELADAERVLQRYQATKGAGAVTESVLDDAKSAVERARIALDRARVALGYRTIRAPFTGYIGFTEIDPGAEVDPTTLIATMDDRDVLWVTFEVPELFYGQIERGQTIAVSTWSHGSEQTEGTVIDIDSRVSAATRTFAVRAEVVNEDDALRPGMSFRVHMDLPGGRYPVVPEVALQWGGDGAYVWAVYEGVAKKVSATVVQRKQGYILVEADLPEGSSVVTEGIQRMREGQSVERVEG